MRIQFTQLQSTITRFKCWRNNNSRHFCVCKFITKLQRRNMISPLKRDLPVLLLSFCILIAFFVIMQRTFRTSVAIQDQLRYGNNNANIHNFHEEDEHFDANVVDFGVELFEDELRRRQSVAPDDSREQKSHLKPQMKPSSTTPPPPTLAQRLKAKLQCHDRTLEPERIQYGEYWLVRNFLRGTISTYVGCADTITYTTNGDYTFFDSLPQLVQRWLAPISFAIYAPGYDMNATMDSISYVRNCLPESALIRKYVTFHIYFPAAHMPPAVPLSELEATLWPYDCYVAEAPYENVEHDQLYKSVNNLTYPINVGRNIARKAANTYFIFACDIELFPSPGLAQKFLALVERNQSVYFDAVEHKRVYPLPVFEIAEKAKLPANKTELVQMLRSKQAILFHAKICANCHRVPGQSAWENATETSELSITAMTKRERSFAFWEPFYISDNNEPMFDERVTWEGQSNKRIQGYAMCLLHYEYHILHPAFLVHTPGIKYFNKNSPRLKYVPPMNKLIKATIQPEYQILYGNNTHCRT